MASVAAVAAAARVFVFSKAFLGALGFSQVFFSFLWSHRASSKFLGFPVLLETLRGAFGYLRGPFVSFGVSLGSPWSALGPPFGRCGSLWHPLGVALGSLWGTSGVSLVALGSLGLPGAARGCPKMLKTRKHTFLRVFVHVSKSMCFCVFLEAAKGPCIKTHVFLCVFVFSRPKSLRSKTYVFLCVFEARFSENTRFCGFLCLGHF